MYLKYNEKSLFDSVETRKTDVFSYKNVTWKGTGL